MAHTDHHGSDRHHPMRKHLARQRNRTLRQAVKRFARNWDDDAPLPTSAPAQSSCGHGCCW